MSISKHCQVREPLRLTDSRGWLTSPCMHDAALLQSLRRTVHASTSSLMAVLWTSTRNELGLDARRTVGGAMSLMLSSVTNKRSDHLL